MKNIFFFLFTVGFIFSSPVQAMLPACQKADSTSSIQNCLKKELENAQERLNEIYVTINEKFETPEDRKQLEELQQVWLNYRDQECMWESQHVATPALKNINELSCMAKVTVNRAALLEAAYMDIDEEQTRQHIASPRWENALVNDYKNFHWNTKKANRFDLTCNDIEEIIVEGVGYVEDKNKTESEEENNPVLFSQKKAIAVVQNPPVGKPTIKVFEFPVFEKDSKEGLCGSALSFSFEKETVEESEKTAENQACESKIIIAQKKCTDKEISWSGSEFMLNDPEETEETEE